jgi:hypothetical protein
VLGTNGAGSASALTENGTRGFVGVGKRDGKKPKPTQHQTQDRAAVVARAVVLVFEALLAWFDRDDANLAAARAEVETILRDEFHDIARTTRDEIRTD